MNYTLYRDLCQTGSASANVFASEEVFAMHMVTWIVFSVANAYNLARFASMPKQSSMQFLATRHSD
jgi:hypothetical protein